MQVRQLVADTFERIVLITAARCRTVTRRRISPAMSGRPIRPVRSATSYTATEQRENDDYTKKPARPFMPQHREILAGEQLLKDMKEQRERKADKHAPTLRDASVACASCSL